MSNSTTSGHKAVRPATRRPSLVDAAVGSALFGGTLAVYVWTLAPGLLLNDSAELQTLAYTVGHTHPTDYPVYILLAHVATWLPIDSVAWRVNLFSAVCGALAVVELFALVRLLTGQRWLAALAAAQLAVSPTFWSQAIIAEVYVPAAALMCGVLLLLVVWRRTGRAAWLAAAAALGGLSIGVHLTVGLMAPAALLFVVTERHHWLRHLGVATGSALSGVVLTLLAFAVVDRNRPPSDYFRAVVAPSCSEWGLAPEQIDDFSERLKFSLSAVQYRDNLRHRSLDDVRKQARDYLRNLPRELPWLWLAAAVIGTLRLLLTHTRFGLLLLVTLAAHALYVARHNMGDIQVAYIPSYVVLVILAACNLGVRRPVNLISAAPSSARAWGGGLAVACVIALGLSMLLPMFRDGAWTEEGRRAVWVPEGEPPFEVDSSGRLAAAIRPLIADLEQGAVVFCEWSHLYAFYYIAHVEAQRTDLMFVQAYPAIGQTRLAASARDLIRAEIARRPIYLVEPLPELADEFRLEPASRGGLMLFRVWARADESV